MRDFIKCYVSGQYQNGNEKEGIVSFAVPEYGVLFRCMASGTKAELEIIAFLSFLKFAEHNLDIFKTRQLRIFTDFSLLVYIMNNGAVGMPGMEAVVSEAKKYSKKMEYTVKWISEKENRAAESVVNIPQMPVKNRVKIKTFANLNITKPKQDLAGNSDTSSGINL
ncbi:MAG: hypothetical protein V3V99_00920 [candidate division Zixibacteria bacterium]